jgi:hypothetical protein
LPSVTFIWVLSVRRAECLAGTASKFLQRGIVMSARLLGILFIVGDVAETDMHRCRDECVLCTHFDRLCLFALGARGFGILFLAQELVRLEEQL